MNQVVLKDLLANVDQEKAKADMLQDRIGILTEVDKCASFEQELKEKAAALRDQAKLIMEEARRIEMQREELIGEVRSAMEKEGFQKLPGNLYEIVLKPCQPKLIVDKQPNEFDAEAYPYLVRPSFEWDINKLKAMIAMGSTISWARLAGGTSITFKKKEEAK